MWCSRMPAFGDFHAIGDNEYVAAFAFHDEGLDRWLHLRGFLALVPRMRGYMTDDCRECKQPLVEIDNRGKRLTGCMTCNIWWTAEDNKVRLSEEDLRALHAIRRA